MKHLAARTISAGTIVLLLAGLFIWPEPALAGVSEWSAETVPDTAGNMLGPAGIDIRDYAIGNDAVTIYAVPGDSIAANITYKSINAGVTWSALPTGIRPNLIAVAPDDNNLVAVANNSTCDVYLSINGGTTWDTLNAPSGTAAAGLNDIAISTARNGKHYITAAGWEAGNIGNVWYFPYSDTFPAWHITNTLPGFTAQTDVNAIAFSPSFAGDAVLVAVTENTSTGVNIQLFNFASLTWNTSASYTGYPCAVVSATGLTRIISASLTLASNYNAQDEDHRDLFIGLTLAGDAGAVASSGIYRFRDIIETNVLVNKPVHSVAYNGSYLIAGSYSDTTVYRVQSPLATTLTIKTSTTTKNPGGENRVLAAWMGTTLAVGTGGNESAFSVSKDNGTTFTDISLIDTVITNAKDVAVTANAGKIYFVTDDGADTSLWYKTSNIWTRVFSLKATTDYIVRTERQNGNIVYLLKKGAAAIYYNNNSGSAQWQNRNCSLNVQDIAVESTTVVYALDAAGKVTKSTNGGQFWNGATDTTLASGNMLYSISAGKLLVGSKDGYIAYSLDGATSWTKIPEAFDLSAGNMYVVPDQNFTTNKVIYAASSTAGKDIKKWQIGASTEWTDIFNGLITGGVFGLAIDTNTLYALEYNAVTNQSTLWRFINPTNATATSIDWVGITTTPTTDDDDANVRFNAAPQALKVSASKLWAVKTNGTNKLYSFSDAVTGLTITLNQPQDRFTSRINSITGIAYDVVLTWKRPSIATQYELLVSTESDFSRGVTKIIVTSTENMVSVFLGPNQVTPNNINFAPGTTYYWKLRTTKPGYSLFSESRSFSIELLPSSPGVYIQLLAPAAGSTTGDTTPAFSWEPSTGAEEYQFMLSESLDMSSPLMDVKVETAGIQISKELEGGKTYFWCVRVTSPITGEWSALGIFTVAEAIPPPVIEKEPTPTYTIDLPTETQAKLVFPPAETTVVQVVPGYLIITIITGLVLIAAVIFLIFKQRR